MIDSRLASLGRTLVIVNPVAQSGAATSAAEHLQRFLTLYSHRHAFDLKRTERPRHATEIAADTAGYDTVLALGGDGVVHEVVCGLMRIAAAKRPTLGVIPVGSGNDFARTLGIAEIAGTKGTGFTTLVSSVPHKVDVMNISYEMPGALSATGITRPQREVTYAVETASFGLDAAIAIDTQALRRWTHLSGATLYAASGLRCFGVRYRDFPAEVSFDGGEARRLRTIIFAIQNGPTYGSGFRICPEANPSDGLLDICYAEGPVARTVALPVFLSAKSGAHIRSKHIRMKRVRRVELAFPEHGYPIQVDGERLQATKLAIEVEPQALSVLKPK